MANSINDLIDQKLRESATKKAMDEMRSLRDRLENNPMAKCIFFGDYCLPVRLNIFVKNPDTQVDEMEAYKKALKIRANDIYMQAVKKYKNKVDAVVAEVFKDDPFLVEEVNMEEAKEIQKASTNV